jgi:beta-glucosidase-like glycosyl hydrolase
LIRMRGAAMGAEFAGKGVHVALGPMMNMGRVAEGMKFDTQFHPTPNSFKVAEIGRVLVQIPS